ncbi:Metallo-dependent phosphatase-like protein [Hygrophoropsis aurantiaca]|uniref:Metallo-dependent phosphatase-like protein n=1 Tax=Hygrophoropsis aurantiaca TaxID=72124 RepID=A0ACB8AIJ4_9AGAM|nr:Metallo-dependent phosphatase-like protein [Hygrophoropsis aurantiaca]
MVLVLLIGDLHIPHRTHDLPAKFRKLLVPGKIQHVLSTGNLADSETLDFLRGVVQSGSGDGVCVVRGDYDLNPAHPLPLSATVTHGSIRIGIIHGHQCVPPGDLDALAAIARQMDVDVLVSGHTHTFQALEYDGRFFVNPGSATGAWSGMHSSNPTPTSTSTSTSVYDTIPSFALMDIQGSVVVTYVYQLVEGEVRVEKVEWRKEERAALGERGGPVGTSTGGTAGMGAYAGGTGGIGGVGTGGTAPQSIPSSPQHAVW